MSRQKGQIDSALKFFSLDTNIFSNPSDPTIEILIERFGCIGFAVYINFLCRIYGNGYYLEYNEDILWSMQKQLNVKVNTIRQVLNFLLERSLFDNKLFESDKILTSHGIQVRYEKAIRSRATKTPREFGKYWILKNEDADGSLKVAHLTKIDNKNDDFSKKNELNSEKNALYDNIVNNNSNSSNNKTAYEFYSENINPLPSITEIEEMKYWLDEVGIEEDMFIEAIKTALMNNKRNMKYIIGILKNKVKQGIKTKQAYLNDEKIKGEIKNDGAKHNRSVKEQQKSDRGSDEAPKQFPKSFGLYI